MAKILKIGKGHVIEGNNEFPKKDNLKISGDFVSIVDNTSSTDVSINSGLSSKGEMLVHNGTNIISLSPGANGYVLSADDTQAAGLLWVPNTNGSSLVSSDFTQPSVGGNVTVSVNSTAWMAEGAYIFIETGGIYEVITVIDSTSVTIQNLYSSNAPVITTIPTNSKVVAHGANGSNAYTISTSGFTVPAVGATVAVSVADSSWVAIGQNLYIQGAGYYQVTTKAGGSVTVENLGYLGNALESTSIPTSRVVTPAGVDGADGVSAYSTVTADFSVPAANSTVELTVDTSLWMIPDQVVFINGGAGGYKVISKSDAEHVTVENLGLQGNAAPPTVISNPVQISPGGIQGEIGQGSFTTTTADFTQPAINSTVNVSVDSTIWVEVGSYVYNATGGVYKVTGIISSTEFTLENTGDILNAVPTTVISSPATFVSSSKSGRDSFTRTTSAFIVPALNSTVTVDVIDTSWITAEMYLFIENSNGVFKVTNVSSNTLTIENVDPALNPTDNIPSNSLVIATGKPGVDGIDGTNSIATTTSGFTMPSFGVDVTVDVDSSDGIPIGVPVFMEDAGYFTVTSKPSATQLQLNAYEDPLTATGGTSIGSGKLISPAGLRGADDSEISIALELVNQVSDPTELPNKVLLYAKDNELYQRTPDGTVTKVNAFDGTLAYDGGNITFDASSGSYIFNGDGTTNSASITLNCEQNDHGITIKAPGHSAAASYTLELPDDIGTGGQALITDGVGKVYWGSVSSGFTGDVLERKPATLDLATLWFDADDRSTITFFSGLTFDTWTSKGLDTRVATAWPSARPGLVENGANNRDYVEFTFNVGERFNFTDYAIPSSYTCFFVGLVFPSGRVGGFGDAIRATLSKGSTGYYTVSGDNIYFSDGTNKYNATSTGIQTDTWFVITTKVSNGVGFARANGTDLVVTSSVEATGDLNAIGYGYNTANGALAEAILIPSALDTPEIELVEAYLASRWGLHNDLDNNHPYKDGYFIELDDIMIKPTYDGDGNKVVDVAAAIEGTPSSNQYYGTDGVGIKGFHDFPSALGTIRITQNDLVDNYIETKLVGNDYVALRKLNAGGDEKLKLDINTSSFDESTLSGFSNVVIRFDSSQGVTASGGTVTSWVGIGSNGSTATASGSPTINYGALNGRDTITLANGDYFSFTPIVELGAAQFGWIAVMRRRVADAPVYTITTDPQGTDIVSGVYYKATQGRVVAQNKSDGRRETADNFSNDDQWHILVYRPFGSTGYFAIDGNPHEITTSGGSTNSPSTNSWQTIGKLGTNYSDGDIAEIIYLPNISLDDTQKQAWEGVLAAKWGLLDVLPDTHPYKDGLYLDGVCALSIYDPDGDGIVNQADLATEAIDVQGTPTADQYYGTDGTGTKGFYDLPSGGGLDSVSDGTTTVNNATAIEFTSGAVVTQNGTVAEVAVSGGGATLPTTTKGDLIVHNGSTDVRLPVSIDTNTVLRPDPDAAEGVAWKQNVLAGAQLLDTQLSTVQFSTQTLTQGETELVLVPFSQSATISLIQEINAKLANIEVLFTDDTTIENVLGIQFLLQGDSIQDKSDNSFSLTTSGTVSVSNTQAKFNTTSLQFGSAGASHVETGTSSIFNIPAEFTIEFWYYRSTEGSLNTVFELNAYTNGILFRPNGTGGRLYVNGSSLALSNGGFDLLPSNQWNHVAMSRDSSSTLRVFFNGTVVYSSVNTSNINSTNGKLRIGQSIHTTGQYFVGFVDGFRYIKGVSRYNNDATFVPSEQELGLVEVVARTFLSGVQTNYLRGENKLYVNEYNTLQDYIRIQITAGEATPTSYVYELTGLKTSTTNLSLEAGLDIPPKYFSVTTSALASGASEAVWLDLPRLYVLNSLLSDHDATVAFYKNLQIGGEVVDFIDPFVLSVLNFEGNNGDTNTTDEINRYTTNITFNGSVQISNLNSVFGLTSLYNPDASSTVSCLTMDNQAMSLLGEDDYTFECFYTPESLPTSSGDTILDTRPDSSSTTGVACSIMHPSNIFRVVDVRNSNVTQIDSTTAATIGQAYHVAIVKQGVTLYLFIDGILQGTNTVAAGGITANGTVKLLGNAFRNGSPVTSANGWLDGFKFARRALYTANFQVPTVAPSNETQDSEAVTSHTLLLNGNEVNGGTDDTGNYTITLAGSATSNSTYQREGQNTLYFPGTLGSYFTIPYNDALHFWRSGYMYSLEFFIYVPGSTSNISLLGDMFVGSAGGAWYFRTNSSNQIRFDYYNGATVALTGTDAISSNTWHHIRLTRVGLDLRIFLDGKLNVQATVQGTPSTFSNPLVIGQNNNVAYELAVSDLRIISSSGLYESDFTVNTDKFTTSIPFESTIVPYLGQSTDYALLKDIEQNIGDLLYNTSSSNTQVGVVITNNDPTTQTITLQGGVIEPSPPKPNYFYDNAPTEITQTTASLANNESEILNLPFPRVSVLTKLQSSVACTVTFLTNWTPADIETSLWLDATDENTITLDTGAVSAWTDKSQNAYSFTQATSTDRPIVQSNGINGLSCLEFDGTDYLNGGDILDLGSESMMVFTVVKFDSNASQGVISKSIFGAGSGRWSLLIDSNQLISLIQPNGTQYLASGAFSDTTPVVATAVYDNVANTNSLYVFDQHFGNSPVSIPAYSGLDNTIPLIVGGYWNVTATALEFGLDGQLGEIIILKGANCTAENKLLVEGYLANKWGLSDSFGVNPYKYGGTQYELSPNTPVNLEKLLVSKDPLQTGYDVQVTNVSGSTQSIDLTAGIVPVYAPVNTQWFTRKSAFVALTTHGYFIDTTDPINVTLPDPNEIGATFYLNLLQASTVTVLAGSQNINGANTDLVLTEVGPFNTFVYSGAVTGWVHSAGGGGGNTGDMEKTIYDTNDDGKVDASDLADNIAGSPTVDQYYGTDGTGTKGFYDLPSGGLNSVTDGTTTVNNPTDIDFTSGATVTVNGTTAEIAISGGGTSLPTTTKGDLVVHNGSTDVRLPVSIDPNTVLRPDPSTAEGVAWKQNVLAGAQLFDNQVETVQITTSVLDPLQTELIYADISKTYILTRIAELNQNEVRLVLLKDDNLVSEAITNLEFLANYDTAHTVDETGNYTLTWSGSAASAASPSFPYSNSDFGNSLFLPSYPGLVSSQTEAWTIADSDFTIETIFYVVSVSAGQYLHLFSISNGTTSTRALDLYLNPSLNLGGLIQYNSTQITGVGSSPLQTGTWYNAVLERHGNTLYLYINGTIVDTQDVTGIACQNVSGQIRIGEVVWVSSVIPTYIASTRFTLGTALYKGAYQVLETPFDTNKYSYNALQTFNNIVSQDTNYLGYTDQNSLGNLVPMLVSNLSGSSSAITLDLDVIKTTTANLSLEAGLDIPPKYFSVSTSALDPGGREVVWLDLPRLCLLSSLLSSHDADVIFYSFYKQLDSVSLPTNSVTNLNFNQGLIQDESPDNTPITSNGDGLVSQTQFLGDGGSSYFTNTTGYLSWTDIDLGTTPQWTVELWINTATVPAASSDWFSVGRGASGTGAILLYSDAGIVYLFAGSGAPSWELSALQAWNTNLLNTWVCYAFTYDGATCRAFQNGVLLGSADFTPKSSTSWSLGAANDGSRQIDNVYFDNITVYTECLYTANYTPNQGLYTDTNLNVITSISLVNSVETQVSHLLYNESSDNTQIAVSIINRDPSTQTITLQGSVVIPSPSKPNYYYDNAPITETIDIPSTNDNESVALSLALPRVTAVDSITSDIDGVLELVGQGTQTEERTLLMRYETTTSEGGLYTLTLNGDSALTAPPASDARVSGNVLEVNASTSYAEFNSKFDYLHQGNTSFLMQGMAYISGTSFALFSTNATASANIGFSIYASGGNFGVNIGRGVSGQMVVSFTTPNYPLNTWFKFTVTYYQPTVTYRIYIDDNLEASQVQAYTPSQLVATYNAFTGRTYPFSLGDGLGYMDNLVIHTGARVVEAYATNGIYEIGDNLLYPLAAGVTKTVRSVWFNAETAAEHSAIFTNKSGSTTAATLEIKHVPVYAPVDTTWFTRKSDFTAKTSQGYFVDTTDPVSVTLPDPNEIGATFYLNLLQASTVTVLAGSQNINGANTDLVLSEVGPFGTFVYSGATKGWVYSSSSSGSNTGDMEKITYDSNDDGTVDSSDLATEAINIQGTPTNSQYYGTDGTGTKGFHDLPAGGSGLDSVSDGTTTVTNPTDIEFVSGATVTQNGTTAEVDITGGGGVELNRVYAVITAAITI